MSAAGSEAARPATVRRAPPVRRTLVRATLGFGLLAAAACLLAPLLGSTPISLRRALDPSVPFADNLDAQIFFVARLPRGGAAALGGSALAAAGVVFQALLRNPLADPYIIGTAAGASLGAVLGIVGPALVPGLGIGLGSAWLGLGLIQVLAFVGGLATVLLVYAVARTGGRTPVVTLLLTGYAVSAVLAAVVALLMFQSGRALAAVYSWLMGSLADASWSELGLSLPLIVVAFALLLVRWRPLKLLLLGDAQAATLGIDVEREKLRLTVLATLSTSAAVAISGTIGFVGLVVPHLLRLAAGPDHRLLLPASLLFGGVPQQGADLGARLAGGVPVGIVTALFGAPFFLYLLRRARMAVAA